MDVILDTNIFLKDPAFKRNHFGELFAYLRRTDSCLVIPTVVREELQQRYRERLSREINAARSSWSSVKALVSLDYTDAAFVDIDKEVQLLGERLKHPAKGVRDSIFLNSEFVNIDELVERGIKRRKPADQNGEQLRDVLVWLFVVDYASRKGCEIAFLSEDLDFRVSKDHHELHPDLCAEVSAKNLSLSFHTAVSRFVTTHALKKTPLDGPWWSQIVPVKGIEDEVIKLLPKSEQIRGSLDQIVIESFELAGGSQYVVSPDSQYIEATYKGKVLLTISELAPKYIAVNQPTYAPNFVFDINAQIKPVPLAMQMGLENNVASWKLSDFSAAPTWAGPAITASFINEAAPEKYSCSLWVELSGRLDKAAVVKWEIDSLIIDEASRVPS